MPGNGPGRDPDCGNFHLNEWRAFSGGQPCALAGFLVEYDERHEFPRVIDGKIDESMGWSNWPRAGQTNTAIVTTRLQRAADDDLKIELYFSRAPANKLSNLGRFRLSVTGDPGAFVGEQKRFAAMKPTDPWSKLGGRVRLERSHR